MRHPSVAVTLRGSEVTVEGPQEFVEQLDWPKLTQASHRFMDVDGMSRQEAVAAAVQTEYEAWLGRKAAIEGAVSG